MNAGGPLKRKPSIYSLDLPETLPEVQSFCDTGDGPGEDVEQIEGRDGLEEHEDREDPDDTEDAGAQNNNNSGNCCASKSSGSCDAVVHQRRETVGDAHDGQTVEACLDDCGIGSEKSQELSSEEDQGQTDGKSECKCIEHADQIGLHNAVLLICTVVLADEAAACGVEGSHGVIGEAVRIDSSRITCYNGGVESVHTVLNEQVSDLEDRILNACRQTNGQQQACLRMIQLHGGAAERMGTDSLHQCSEDADRRDVLGDDGRKSYAGHTHLKDNDKY